MNGVETSNIICKRIIAEPGDMTRYDFIIHQDYDDFVIMPYKSPFAFPQRLNWYDIQDIKDLSDAVNRVNTDNRLELVNPHTLLTVVNVIKLIADRELL